MNARVMERAAANGRALGRIDAEQGGVPMATLLCEARATCGTTCGQGPCPLVMAWARRISLVHRTRAQLGALSDVELRDIGICCCKIRSLAAVGQ